MASKRQKANKVKRIRKYGSQLVTKQDRRTMGIKLRGGKGVKTKLAADTVKRVGEYKRFSTGESDAHSAAGRKGYKKK